MLISAKFVYISRQVRRIEQNRIYFVRIGKSEAEVTTVVINDCARGIVLLKLTTYRQSSGLSAAAALLVLLCTWTTRRQRSAVHTLYIPFIFSQQTITAFVAGQQLLCAASLWSRGMTSPTQPAQLPHLSYWHSSLQQVSSLARRSACRRLVNETALLLLLRRRRLHRIVTRSIIRRLQASIIRDIRIVSCACANETATFSHKKHLWNAENLVRNGAC